MTKQKTAQELLREIMQDPNWSKGLDITYRDKWYYKNVENLSTKKATELLNSLGWHQVKPPVWEKK